ncbi:MAG: ribonuclease J [Candidatus Sericytochromatia bacterium]|nr:ribonuclease J [Candidatus Sericytochromatia bacterium]
MSDAPTGQTVAPAPGTLHLVPLGGLGEIGKNMWCLRAGDDIVVLDCGFAFPSDDMHGVDYVLPDYRYLEANAERVRAVFISHGHEDHIGGLPYLLDRVPVPVYATPLTRSLIEGKLQEHGLLGRIPLLRMDVRDPVTLGSLTVEFLRVPHSIPDSVAISVKTPVGTVLYSGDFKFDATPIDGQRADYHGLSQLGEEGLLLLLSDSTNVLRPGFTPSEAAVGPALDAVFAKATGRLVVTTFASNIHRVQQVMDAAARQGRKVALVGRSMVNVCERARALGYLRWEAGLVVEPDAMMALPREQALVLTTGSQGEPLAGLSRLAAGEHRGVRLEAGDTVVISAIPIPGNERSVSRLVNMFFERGIQVVSESQRLGTHVSGHASEEELKLMLALTRPRFFVPMHGELRHLIRHAELARALGVPETRVAILRNGDVLEVGTAECRVVDRVPASPTLVDGRAGLDVGQSLLRERQRLARDGMVTTVLALDDQGTLCAGPDMVTRGFLEGNEEAQWLLDEGKRRVVELVDELKGRGEWNQERLEKQISDALARFFSERTGRKPVQLLVLQRV